MFKFMYLTLLDLLDLLDLFNLRTFGKIYILCYFVSVFGFSKFVQIQTLYTMALLISFALLYVWYDLRKKVVKGTSNGPSKWMWIFLILPTILASVYTLHVKLIKYINFNMPFGRR
jgi:hypothetical protein